MSNSDIRPTPESRRRAELIRYGYTFVKLSTCKSCERNVEVWLTKKKRSVLYDTPMTPGGDQYCHFDTCTKRGQQPAHSTTQADAAGDIQQALERLGARHQAKAVVMLFGETAFEVVWQDSADGEDIRSGLIAVGNHVRQQIRERAQ